MGHESFYNNTLGIAGVIRLNSGDSKDVKAITTSSLTEGSTTSPWTLIHAGANSTLSTSTTGDCNNGGTGSFGTSAGCRYYVENVHVQIVKPPQNVGCLRLIECRSFTFEYT